MKGLQDSRKHGKNHPQEELRFIATKSKGRSAVVSYYHHDWSPAYRAAEKEAMKHTYWAIVRNKEVQEGVLYNTEKEARDDKRRYGMKGDVICKVTITIQPKNNVLK